MALQMTVSVPVQLPPTHESLCVQAVQAAVATVFPGMAGAAWRHQAKSGDYSLAATDAMTILTCTGTITITTTAAASISGFMCLVKNAGTGVVTIGGIGYPPNSFVMIRSNGSAVSTETLSGLVFLARGSAAATDVTITGLSPTAQAEELLVAAKPHLFGITSDYQPPMRAKDCWATMCWTGDGAQMNREIPEIAYVLGTEGGEIWEDNWAIVAESERKDAAYAFLDFMIDPAIAAKETEFHGYPQVDQRATDLVPEEILNNPILYPPQELLEPLEFGAAETLTNPDRSELWARVKSA